jgi:DNA-binding HxlR family transcriptional regulator
MTSQYVVSEDIMSEVAIPRVDTPCPIGRAAELIGDRWTLLILRHATLGVTRFDDFRRELGIADNILSNRLGKLVQYGLLVKVPYRDERRTRHEYRLAEAGADMLPILHALATWGQRHTRATRRGKPMRIIHSTCGNDLPAGEYCEHCGRPASREEILWLRPWRSHVPTSVAAYAG